MRILVVEDERRLAGIIRRGLTEEGYAVDTAYDGEDAKYQAENTPFDLMVLDIMLPKKDGVTVCRELRQERVNVPILMLTARADETDKIIGLSVGADDYMTKPFSPRELVARVKAMLRRGRGLAGADHEPVLVFRHLRIDAGARRVWKDETLVELTAIEFDLLVTIARQVGHVFSREQLIEQVSGTDYYGDERVVDVHLGHLRRKVEDDATRPALIVTVRGAGYRFEDTPV